MELQTLINTFYQPLVYKIDLTSPLGTKIEPPDFQREMELTLRVNEVEFNQCEDKIRQPNNELLNIELSYKNVEKINCKCILIGINCELNKKGNEFWVDIIIIDVPREITIQNNIYKSWEIYEEIIKIKSGGRIEHKRIKVN